EARKLGTYGAEPGENVASLRVGALRDGTSVSGRHAALPTFPGVVPVQPCRGTPTSPPERRWTSYDRMSCTRCAGWRTVLRSLVLRYSRSRSASVRTLRSIP